MAGFFRTALPLLALMLVGIGVAALIVGAPEMLLGREDGEDKVSESETEPVSRVSIPPLDAAERVRTETATFSLG